MLWELGTKGYRVCYCAVTAWHLTASWYNDPVHDLDIFLTLNSFIPLHRIVNGGPRMDRYDGYLPAW